MTMKANIRDTDSAYFFCCSVEYECLPDYWKCANGICVDKNYVCDGEEDCDDGSDELSENCSDTQPPQ